LKRSPLKPGKGFQRKSPMPTTGMLSVFSAQRSAPARKAELKTKQLAVTAEEKALWSRLAALGCIACMKDGVFNTYVSIHHVDGRTKPGCHKLVLPLCAPHHQQDDTDPVGRIAVHPNKARFERRYGSQVELIAQCVRLLTAARTSGAAAPTIIESENP
jgi:hypothetical protein